MSRHRIHPRLQPRSDTPGLDRCNLLKRVVQPAARKAGLPWVTLLHFRRTCATTLFRHGLNAEQVESWLGHHSAAFTLITYVHLLEDDLPDLDFLDDIITTPGSGQQLGKATTAISEHFRSTSWRRTAHSR